MIEIVENLAAWGEHFEANFLAHYHENGHTDFKQYQYVTNKQSPAGKAIDISKSRLVFITTAGGYLEDSQEPFEAHNLLGDYSVKTFPLSTPLDAIAYAHDHYNHHNVKTDAQVLVPLRHLEAMVEEGIIGEVAPTVIGYMGYQPDVRRIVNELIPQVVGLVKEQNADAALLVPA